MAVCKLGSRLSNDIGHKFNVMGCPTISKPSSSSSEFDLSIPIAHIPLSPTPLTVFPEIQLSLLSFLGSLGYLDVSVDAA